MYFRKKNLLSNLVDCNAITKMNNHYLDEQCNEIQSNLKQNSDKTPVKIESFSYKKISRANQGIKNYKTF